MIPYFYYPTIQFGPLTLHTWGMVVAIGALAALWVAYKKAERDGLNPHVLYDLTFWILVLAFLGARLSYVFFYNWGSFSGNLISIVKIWEGGLSSFGGFVGATAAFVWYSRKHGLDMWRYADILMFAWPLGHGIARIGCFINHLHIGKLSSLPIAVAFPDGARLDMGLIESVVLLCYWSILWIMKRGKKHVAGFYLVTGMLFYGITRFVLDFFRATDISMPDARYLGLTPAQYGSAILVFLGFLIMWYRGARRHNTLKHNTPAVNK